MKVKSLLILLSLLFLVSCASNMVLYRDDIKGFDLALDTLPKSPYCNIIQSEYKTGQRIIIAKGTRWVDPVSAEKKRYVCRVGSDNCQNTVAVLTSITQQRKHILDNCKRVKPHKRKQEQLILQEEKVEKPEQVVVQEIGDETKRSMAFDNLLNILLDKKIIAHQEQQYLYFNFSYFTAELIQEADITDLEGSILLGTSQPIIEQLGNVPFPYQVQQVLDDMVILECGKCSLPPIGIRRVNGRPSPIEDQIFNDTRAIYQFVGTHHYRTVLNERKQVILFDRISMKSLKLPNNYLHEVMPNDFL
jgi:hypothetical protein